MFALAPACAGRATSVPGDAGENALEGGRSASPLEASAIADPRHAADAVAESTTPSDAANEGAARDEGFVGAAKVLGVGWSDAVTTRCAACGGPDRDGCLREDGSLVPSPFQLICLTQLAETDNEVRRYLVDRVQMEQRDIEAWTHSDCVSVVTVADTLPVPDVARGCFARDFTCPEQREATACDGKPECVSGEDERFCGVIAPTFVCHHGALVAWSRVCNGVYDCQFGEDEVNCYARPAP